MDRANWGTGQTGLAENLHVLARSTDNTVLYADARAPRHGLIQILEIIGLTWTPVASVAFVFQ